MDWKKSPWKTKIGVLFFIFVLVVLLITTVFGKKGLIEIYKARRSFDELQTKIEELKTKKTRLEKEIAALEANPKAVEREARDKLWLSKPDEKIVIKSKK